MAKAPEGIMVEPGCRQIGEEAEITAGGHVADGSTAHTPDASGADAEMARRARSLGALDEIMKVHHDVLAALVR